MKRTVVRHSLAFLSIFTLGAGLARTQTAPSAPASATSEAADETITLDPFTVTTEHEGYKADDTLAGGRVRTSLKDTPASLSVVTKKFMDDLGITNATDLLVYTASTEVSGLFGNYSGLSNRSGGIGFGGSVEAGRLVNPAGVNRARGLTAMDNTRNYIPSDIPWDGFNISRVDISRGPNSFLFGTGSPSGISNVSTNEATYKDRGSVELKVGSYGSFRESLDYNKVLLANQLSIRLDLVNSNTKYKQEPAFNSSKRVYGALRFDPNFLKTDSAHTKIMASFEHGDVNSNNPRILPPVDYVTGYLNDPRKSTTGIDPWQYNQNTLGGRADPKYSYWTSAGSIGNHYMWGGTPQFYYDGQSGGMLGAGQPSFTVAPGNVDGANTWAVHSGGFANYANTVNYLYTHVLGYSEAAAPYRGSAAGTVSYLDQTLSDTSVFDFYNKLIDGNNKREFQKWDAYNVSITQSLFNDRLTVQALFDHEKYSSGSWGLFADSTPIIMLDLDRYLLAGNPTWLGNATVNPNLGRPMVFSNQGKRNRSVNTRDNYQATVAYQLDFAKDFGMKGALAQILGHHSFTGLLGRYDRSSMSESFNLNGVDSSYLKVTGQNSQAKPKDNNFNWLAYVGPSLLGTTGSGANLSNLQTNLTVPSSANFRIWSNDWTNPSVAPTDPYTYPTVDGSTKTTTQKDNPANYRGWITSTFPIINGGSNPILATGGNKAEQRIDSKAIMYQGHFWDDTIVPSLGFREDKTKQRGASADTTGDIVNLNYDITKPGVTATTRSTSYGVAVHLPKAIKQHLPEGTDLTFHYFHGENETPRVRYGMDGLPLANESGKTDDYSVQFDGLNNRLTVRLTYFKTRNLNSSASVGTPLGNWMVQGLPALTLQYGSWGLADRALGRNPDGSTMNAPADWPEWQAKGWWRPHGWMDTHPVEAAAFEQAMKTSFVQAYPQSFWDAWGYNVDANAIKNGDWLHVVKGSDNPFGPNLGGSSTINGEYPIIDQNLESKGYELELTFRPVKNWDITFNGSKVNATQTGYGTAATRVLTGMADLYLNTAIQYGNIWDGYEGLKTNFLQNVWAPYLTQISLIGGEQPEQRKYRFNVISNYSFNHGVLKGFNVGGAFRWEDKAILGYGIHEAKIYGQTAWLPDVTQPIYGPTEEHGDLWIGYGHKLNKNIDWRVQLNVRNVGENDHLVTVAVQPDGTIAQRRIASGASYDLGLKFDF